MHDRRLARSRGRPRAVDDRTGHPDSDRARVRARAAREKVEPPVLALSARSCSLYHYHRSQVCEPHLPELHPREFRLRAFDTPASIPRRARKQKMPGTPRVPLTQYDISHFMTISHRKMLHRTHFIHQCYQKYTAVEPPSTATVLRKGNDIPMAKEHVPSGFHKMRTMLEREH
jgi:hypothetical protein